jgi:hypothetical protein
VTLSAILRRVAGTPATAGIEHRTSYRLPPGSTFGAAHELPIEKGGKMTKELRPEHVDQSWTNEEAKAAGFMKLTPAGADVVMWIPICISRGRRRTSTS